MLKIKETLLVLSLVIALPCRVAPVPAPAVEKDILSVGTAAGKQEENERVKRQDVVGAELRAILPRLEKAVDPDEYILGPYDRLLINLSGPEPRSFSVVVLPEGDVFLEGVGAVHADGLTLSEFRISLNRTVNRYFRNIELFCYLQSPRLFRVFVTGEVAKPGAVEASAVERISDALERAGGLNGIGSSRSIVLERDGEASRFDLLRFIMKGDLGSNPFLRSGDRIHVPAARRHASIAGKVRKPGHYEIVPGETAGDLIDLAGGFTSEALMDSVLLNRSEGNGEFSSRTLTADEFDVGLRDLDVISVFDGLEGSRRVFIFGAVGIKGRFHLAPGEQLAELLARAGGLNEYADLDEAFIERKNGELIRVNLREYISTEPVESIPLFDDDIVNVPAIVQVVVVGGEVQEPGKFNYQSDWTVAQYVGLAGGPTEDGSINRVVIYSPDGKTRKADGKTRPGRGDVIIVKRAKSKLIGEFFSGLIRLGTVVISIIVLTK